VIERWDGTAWTIVPTAKLGAVTSLFGVAAVDPSHAWAVGTRGQGHGKPLVEQFDGVSWTIASVQTPGLGDSALTGVAAVSDDDAWSVGYRSRRTTGNPEALVEHSSGTDWTIVGTPRVPHSDYTQLSSVSAVSSTDVWAVGISQQHPRRGPRPLVEHWDGTSWSIVPTPDPGAGSAFYSVAARASDDVWAVGYILRNTGLPLAEHWDGSRWNIVKVDHPGMRVALTGVTATSTDVYASGVHQGHVPLVLRWDGTSFERVSMPRPGGRLGASALWALGTDGSTVWGAGLHVGHGSHPLVEYVC
jgi:hypothetical protein